jgi:ketosteroid isomerase-like protein
MDFYADDATLVVKPGLAVTGKDDIRAAFVRIAEYVQHSLVVGQGRMEVIEGGDTALVIMESTLAYVDAGEKASVTRRATYVFRREDGGRWVCTVDNSYGMDLLA